MKSGSGSKQKGATFERSMCLLLSVWVSANKRTDLFWRSAMSGGRATVARKGGRALQSQAGDITAVAGSGHLLTDLFVVECKHIKDLQLVALMLQRGGALSSYWRTLQTEAQQCQRYPMLIARQNNYPTLLGLPIDLDQTSIVKIPPLIISPLYSLAVWNLEDALESTPFEEFHEGILQHGKSTSD